MTLKNFGFESFTFVTTVDPLVQKLFYKNSFWLLVLIKLNSIDRLYSGNHLQYIPIIYRHFKYLRLLGRYWLNENFWGCGSVYYTVWTFWCFGSTYIWPWPCRHQWCRWGAEGDALLSLAGPGCLGWKSRHMAFLQRSLSPKWSPLKCRRWRTKMRKDVPWEKKTRPMANVWEEGVKELARRREI